MKENNILKLPDYDISLEQENRYFLVVTTGTNDYNESIGQEYKFNNSQDVLIFINGGRAIDIYGETQKLDYYEILDFVQEIIEYDVKYNI